MQRKSIHDSYKRIIVLLLSITLMFTMCAPSVFALGEAWQGTAEGDILIKDTVTKIAENVYEHEVVTNNKEGNDQKIDYLCEIGKSENIKIVACYGKDSVDSWSLTPTTVQAKAYEQHHPGHTVVAGINADFFNMANGQPMGALVMEGKICNNANGRPYFGITKDGNAVIRQNNDLSDLQTAVGGDVILIADGKPVTENTSYGALNYSRTAIGIKADGTVVTFVTHGLNPPISGGRTYTEIAEMLSKEGCVSAIALDGGGSSTFAARPEGSSVLEVRNSPADGAERAVSSSLLVVSTAEPTGVFDHAQLTPNNEVYTPLSQIQFEAKGVDTAGIGMELPKDVKWSLSEESQALGTIDADTGVFKASTEVGEVTINLTQDGKIVGETKIEIAVPDHIYFNTEEVSLGFEEKTNLGIVVRSKGRDMNYKPGDIKWTISDDRMGTFVGNTFISADGASLTGTATATSAYDDTVSGSITVIVGKLPTVVWDFEDKVDDDGKPILAEDYYIGNEESSGVLTHTNYNRGGKESIEIVSSDEDEPVRFGNKSLKLNYDFINCGEVTEGACLGTTEGMEAPGVPTGIGVWVYAPEGVGVDYQGEGTQSGFWLRGYVKDGAGSNIAYDFTLEPKKFHSLINEGKELPKGIEQPGIYWQGWKYLEADLTSIQAPYSIQPGMTFRLMFVAGTKMGTRTANSIYFDNLQFVYGTNIDDTDEPFVASMMLNGEELKDGAVVNTDTITVDAILQDVQNKYTSGIDDTTARMYIDGINVVDNDKYMYGYNDSDHRMQLSNLKLRDGRHTVTVKVKDKFGNEVKDTRSFVIDTNTPITTTTVNIGTATDKAIIGKTIDLQIKASDNTVIDSTTIFKLGNQFKDYEVKFSENYEGTVVKSNIEKTITVNAIRKQDAAQEDDNIIATLSVQVPSDLKVTDYFNYIVSGGKFETADGAYDTYSSSEVKIPIGSDYEITSEPVIVGGEDAEIKVTDNAGNAVSAVGIYLGEDNSLVGNTDKNGILTTNQFNTEGAEAKDYVIYAKDAQGGLSFEYKLSVFAPEGDLNGTPHNVRFNHVEDPSTQKNITWFSNSLNEEKQIFKYAVSGSDDWKTVEANTSQVEFNSGGNYVVDINAVKIEGLLPDTVYDYMVGTEENYSEKATFNTAAENKKTSEFFIIGDIQDPDKSYVRTVAEQIDAANHDYDFGIQIGDAIDQAADYKDWSDLGDVLGAAMLGDTDMISIMGNHEYYGDPNADISSKVYNNPNTGEGGYYSLEYGDVYIAVVNFSNTGTPIKEASEWLVEDAAKSNATWKILCMHQPPYYTNNGGNEPVYEYFPKAAEKAGIDAVFSGHDHSWAVTNPLLNNEVDEENGIPYYIVGAAGHKRYSPITQDKFDYNKIFRRVGEDYKATYLKVSSNQDEMTINVYDIEKGLLDTVVLQSPCKKKGHDTVYDPQSEELRCKVCDRLVENYTGDVFDAEGKEYYLLAGIKQTDWVTVGTEIRYYDNQGVREKVTKDETPSTCIIDGHCIYTSESGAVKRIDYIDAGGHDYEEKDGKVICSKCGWQQFEMSELNVSLSTNVYTYNGNARTPATTAIDPNGNKLAKRPASHPDYYSSYRNNVEVGTATVTMTAARYGTYVDLTSWRGNYKGSVVVPYEIRPTAPTNARLNYENGKYFLTWDAAKYENECVDNYIIYSLADNGEWEEIGTTLDKKFDVDVNKERTYEFRIGSRKVAKDGKSYESVGYATAKSLNVKVTADIREDNGKPTLKWNSNKGATYTVLRSTKEDGNYERVFTTEGTTYTHVSAQPGKTYYYKVEANANGATVISDIVSVTCSIDDPVVKEVSLNADNKPVLTWDNVAGASTYEVYRATSKNGEYEKVFATEGTTYTHVSAKSGMTYYYRVKAIADNNTTSLSDIVSVKCHIASPIIEKTQLNDEGKPTISWGSVTGATQYEVYRAVSENGEYEKVFTTEGTTYTHMSAKPGKTYYYKVQALDETEKTISEVVSIICGIENPIIERADFNDNGKPILSWGKVEGATKYEVYRSTSADGTFEKVFDTTGNTYTHVSAKVGKVYYYRIKAIADNATTSESDVISLACAIDQPIINQAALTDSGDPILEWNKVTGAVKYEVYRAASKEGEYVKLSDVTGLSYIDISAETGKTYYYKVKALGENASLVNSESQIATITCNVEKISVERIGGDDRFETSIKAADSLKKLYGVEKFENIIVAYGGDYPDALSGSYLAKTKKAPILLVNNSTTDAIKEYIDSNILSGGTIYILGGEGVVSKQFEDSLKGYTVKRLSGADRFETNMNILKEAEISDEEVLICSAWSFADSLSAAATGNPILIVGDKLNDNQKEFLGKLSIEKYCLIGGEGAVNADIQSSLKALGIVERISGSDRYATSKAIADRFFPGGSKSVIITSGMDFPDGLSGGPIAIAKSSPIILVNDLNVEGVKDYLKNFKVFKMIVMGESGVIADATIDSIIK